jgi:catechol 2,3-dioxygenase-like lactoylglutathione lyase family enzyme
MLGYVTVGTNNLARATAFYDELFAVLGVPRLFSFERGVYYGKNTMQFGVLIPFNQDIACAGNGAMVALNAAARAKVDELHAAALRLGGVDEGAPGLRGNAAMGFYGAYFRDLDRNKLCVFRMGPDDCATTA